MQSRPPRSRYAAVVRLALRLILVALLVSSCRAEAEPATTTSTAAATTATTTTTTATTIPPPEPCDPPPFLPTALPDRVIDDRPSPGGVPLDIFTLQPGTTVTGWADEDGNPVIVVVRGALPPVPWEGQPERIEVRGFEAAVGALQDGKWAVAWFEGADRCDDYSIILYPPADADTAKMVAGSLTGGG